MSPLQFVALLLALLGPLLALAGLLRLPASLLLFAAGLATAFLPGLPPLQADPHLLTTLFLPPILYAATARVTWHLLRHTLLPGLLAGTAVALATILAVAALAHWLLPDLGWPAALLLGVVAALFDTRLFHEAAGRPKVPRAIADTLKAREMAARVVALAGFALVLRTLTEGEAPAPAAAALGIAWSLLGGALAGLAIGRAVVWLRGWADPPPVEIAVSIATPYLCALAAAWLGLSVVVLVMAAALTVSAARVDRETGAPGTSPEARISAVAFWEAASLLASSLLYLLAGRALPGALVALDDWPLWRTAGAAAAILALVLAIEFLADLASAAEADRTGVGRRRAATAAVMAWASTRSVIGLIVALSVPAMPGFTEARDLVLVVATLMVLGSVLLQGVTLGPAVRAAALGDAGEEQREQDLAVRAAREAAAEAGDNADTLAAARRASVRLREEDRIGDEVLHKTLRETDIKARAAEGPAAALPGAGPPNP
ncbi:cation:proton antiporter domain-containing protein [Roseicella aquatilis]|uniref:Sodium:proton exchanger n=1 Tax=Roseicella aquatilis TaxID=2527868 RepID=A0A4R4D3H4_9PROT|nr:cation:proton antiporter [Roseicella aquatilis]TCZ54249.1 sodium:proton exchanger [Roseicella aquatilis]